MAIGTQYHTTHGAWPRGGPFDLDDEDAYRRWRDRKLAGYPTSSDALMVELDGKGDLSAAACGAIVERCRKTNLAFFALPSGAAAGKDRIRALGEHLGLRRLDANLCADGDGVTSLQVMPEGRHAGYIPYTNRPLNWHTDGYYNPPGQEVRAILMYCVRNASEGGANCFMDPEIVYLLMRDHDPAYVAALMAPDAMTIPPNEEDGVTLRPAQSGPVFAVGPDGALHMRYTARTRSIAWKDESVTRAAVTFIADLLTGDSPYRIGHRLEPGQGVVCNNVLHNRSAYQDNAGDGHNRLLYRARYYDRIAGTATPATQREVTA